jgi:hypothetical protein
MPQSRKEENGRKLRRRRRSIVKIEIDAEAWLLYGPPESGNVGGG